MQETDKTKTGQKLSQKELVAYFEPVYARLSQQYTKGLRPDETLPSAMQMDFYASMEGFDRSMATALSTNLAKSIEEDKSLPQALRANEEEAQAQKERLDRIVGHKNQQFQSYLRLQSMQDYPYYIFLGEKDENSCPGCLERRGMLLNRGDLRAEILPPLHPNCRCRLVAIDNAMAEVYTRNQQGILAQLDAVLDSVVGRHGGGIFYLDHGSATWGILPQGIRALELPSEPAIHGQQNSLLSGLARWAVDFAGDAMNALQAFVDRGKGLFENAGVVMQENGLMGVVLFADALAGGIPSGVWEGIVRRWEEIEEDPSPETVLNFLSLGLVELIDAAVYPEEPLSFDHVMALTGVAMVALGASAGLRGVPVPKVSGRAAKNATIRMRDIVRAKLYRLDKKVEPLAKEQGKVVEIISEKAAYKEFLIKQKDYDNPYWPGTTVYRVEAWKSETFVRSYGGKSGMNGQWIMKLDDVQGLTAAQIQEKFALPDLPIYLCEVHVPAGTILEVSHAGGIMGGKGGGVQYRLVGDRPIDWFINERKLD